MTFETVKQVWEMCCPKCKRDDKIDIAATVWVRLTPDGTDQDEAEDTDTEWSQHSGAKCRSCGFGGNVSDFEVTEGAS